MKQPILEALLMSSYASLKIVEVLPKTDLIYELNKNLTMQAFVLLECLEKCEVSLEDLENLYEISEYLINQIDKLKSIKRKKSAKKIFKN